MDDSAVTMTKQGVRNLNSLGPKKKRPEEGVSELPAPNEEAAKDAPKVAADTAIV